MKPCSKRDKIQKFSRDGTKETVNVCSEPSAEAFQKEVSASICDECPVRQAVVKREKEKKAKPLKFSEVFPIVHDITLHVANGWLPCAARESAYVKSCCGGQSRAIRCSNSASPHYDTEVVKEVCRLCQSRISV